MYHDGCHLTELISHAIDLLCIRDEYGEGARSYFEIYKAIKEWGQRRCVRRRDPRSCNMDLDCKFGIDMAGTSHRDRWCPEAVLVLVMWLILRPSLPENSISL